MHPGQMQPPACATHPAADRSAASVTRPAPPGTVVGGLRAPPHQHHHHGQQYQHEQRQQQRGLQPHHQHQQAHPQQQHHHHFSHHYHHHHMPPHHHHQHQHLHHHAHHQHHLQPQGQYQQQHHQQQHHQQHQLQQPHSLHAAGQQQQPAYHQQTASLEEGWEELRTPEGRTYYINRSDQASPVGQSVWEVPHKVVMARLRAATARGMKLEARWTEVKDPEGRTYFYHVVTKETRWDMPPEVAEVRSRAAGRPAAGAGAISAPAAAAAIVAVAAVQRKGECCPPQGEEATESMSDTATESMSEDAAQQKSPDGAGPRAAVRGVAAEEKGTAGNDEAAAAEPADPTALDPVVVRIVRGEDEKWGFRVARQEEMALTSIADGSPAHRGGLRQYPEWTVSQVNGRRVHRVCDLPEHLSSTSVSLTIVSPLRAAWDRMLRERVAGRTVYADAERIAGSDPRWAAVQNADDRRRLYDSYQAEQEEYLQCAAGFRQLLIDQGVAPGDSYQRIEERVGDTDECRGLAAADRRRILDEVEGQASAERGEPAGRDADRAQRGILRKFLGAHVGGRHPPLDWESFCSRVGDREDFCAAWARPMFDEFLRRTELDYAAHRAALARAVLRSEVVVTAEGTFRGFAAALLAADPGLSRVCPPGSFLRFYKECKERAIDFAARAAQRQSGDQPVAERPNGDRVEAATQPVAEASSKAEGGTATRRRRRAQPAAGVDDVTGPPANKKVCKAGGKKRAAKKLMKHEEEGQAAASKCEDTPESEDNADTDVSDSARRPPPHLEVPRPPPHLAAQGDGQLDDAATRPRKKRKKKKHRDTAAGGGDVFAVAERAEEDIETEL
eukprot:TRINITY_DN6631_c0_g1_i1.p1 TRINITY_DN6631_c0_g1~~TRINITY_DN6631_c0_g1_i1.p1  ORF type:complete len:842 (+),score=116.03 TRINITY_DN6631_c0_g1_i1:68-2593(+)